MTYLVLAAVLLAAPAEGVAVPSPDPALDGLYDCEPCPACRPAGSTETIEGPYLVRSTSDYWMVETSEDALTLRRKVSRSGSGEVPRGDASDVQWGPWTSSEETTCSCPPAGTGACSCHVRSIASGHVVTVSGVDQRYPAEDTTREVDGRLEVQPGPRLVLTIDGATVALRPR